MHAVLQGPGENPFPYSETPEPPGQTGPHFQGAVHFDAISRLKRRKKKILSTCVKKLCKIQFSWQNPEH